MSRDHHVSDRDTPGSTVLYELTRNFHTVLSLLCVAKDSRSMPALIEVAHAFSWPQVRLTSTIVRNLCAPLVECGGRSHCRTPPAFFRRIRTLNLQNLPQRHHELAVPCSYFCLVGNCLLLDTKVSYRFPMIPHTVLSCQHV